MVFELFRGSGESQMQLVEDQLHEMLTTCRQTFDLAVDSLAGRADPSEVGPTIRKLDRSVNRAERAIRRQLVVHVSVRGAGADVPLVLISMSISKDVERIGDYTKNLWDLAAAGIRLGGDAGPVDEAVERTRRLIDDTARIFRARDAKAARELLPTVDGWLDEYDTIVEEQLVSDRPSREGVPLALFYRYLKRIAAHLMNVLTSLVMPLDRLDFWDEDKADRFLEEDPGAV